MNHPGAAGPGSLPGPAAGQTATTVPGGATAARHAAAAHPTVSVIVCAYTEERWDDLALLTASLRGQTEQAEEIILVVDHCQRLLSRARRELPGVTVIPNDQEQGLSGARNCGVAHARSDVLAFIDDDAVPDPGWIATLAGRYSEARVIGVGGRVDPAWEQGRPGWYPPELDWVVGCSYQGLPARTQPVRNFIGASMSFRSEVLRSLGGFSPALGRFGEHPLGCEETELCLRASRRYPGSVLLYEPAAVVRHTVRRSRSTWRYLRSRCFAEGLSKARVAALAGPRAALATERRYLLTTIPRALGRSLGAAAGGNRAALASAAALVLAVLTTMAGYLAGRTAGPLRRLRPAAGPGRLRNAAAARLDGRALIPWAGLVLAIDLWLVALGGVHTEKVATAGLGLIAVLPVSFWAALAVLTAGFCWAVTRPSTRWPVLATQLVALAAILNATPAILYGTLRYSWAWKHVGVIDYIAHHGVDFSLGGILGVYQGWPGFFALNSFLTTAAGQPSALGYAAWALPLNDLLWLGPVILIARAFTTDKRLIWTAAWLFELGNWVGQDYFSPQAFAFFLYLAVVAVCLRWLAGPAAGPGLLPAAPGAAGEPAAAAAPSRTLRLALVICLLPLMVAIASSHQLTPFVLIAALTLLAAFRLLRPWFLPLVMAAITVGWVVYAGLPWLTSNFSQLLEGFGLPWANTSAHLIGEARVPLDQVIIDWGVRALSLAMAVLAVTGFFRYWRRHGSHDRRSWLRVALLAMACLPAVAANSYGGEIIFRAFLFALPFLAVAAAAAFFPHPAAGRSPRTVLALGATALLLLTGFLLGNYGNEAINYFTPQEVAAARWLYRTAPRGAGVVGATSNFPWAFTHYTWYGYTFLTGTRGLSRDAERDPVQTMTRLLRPGHSPASYLILTRSQATEIRQSGEWPPGTYARFTRALAASGRFRVVYRNRDAVIMQLARPGSGAPGGGAP